MNDGLDGERFRLISSRFLEKGDKVRYYQEVKHPERRRLAEEGRERTGGG
ncbi:MAG: hypothetical protein LBT30_03775 [Clostridiales bacterium]|nr:hypothetical protein [Clostridiales bacterium]